MENTATALKMSARKSTKRKSKTSSEYNCSNYPATHWLQRRRSTCYLAAPVTFRRVQLTRENLACLATIIERSQHLK